MMPNNHSTKKLTHSHLAGDASKSAFSLDHPLTSSANKRSKTHSESGKQAKAALDPNKHQKAKHHKAKHHKKQKHVTRFLSPAAGNGVQFADFADISSLTLNGSSSKAGNVLRLTPALKSQAGSAFVKMPYSIDSSTSFNTHFQFRLSGGDGNNGADGMTFMLQNSGANALGTTGGGEGYSTIAKSLAIEFDSFKSGWDSAANQVSLLRNGDVTTPLAVANTPMDLNNSGALNAWIDYNGATDQLSVFLGSSTTKPANALLTTQVDLAAAVGTQAFVGFSAGTGGLTNLQDVENWQFTTSTPAPIPAPIPTPIPTPTPTPTPISSSINFDSFADISSLTLNGNSSQAGNVLRLTPALKSQAGSAFVKTPYSVNSNTSFNTHFQFRLSGGDGNNGADGMTFMLQNSGANALGTTGGGEGYSTIAKSLAIEFDSFKSGWDNAANQVSLLKNGDVTTPLAVANSPIDLNSSGALNAWIDYNGATDQLSVFLGSSTTKPANALLTTQVDLAAAVGTQAFVGFSAGTGGLTNLQDIENWQFSTSTPAPPPPANVIQATNSSETITGMTGNDTVSYANGSDGIIADLGSGFTSRIARIMPLGDSITQGVTDRTTDPNRIGNGGYRVVLSKKFASNGLQADFVGTRSNGTLKGDPAFTDIEHEGHPGQTIEYLTSNATDGGIASYVSVTHPDVVLLMAGTNDLGQKEPNGQFTSAVQMRDRLGLLIDKTVQNLPNIKILVSTIPPIQFDALNSGDFPDPVELAAQQAAQVKRVKDYNELLPGLVAAEKQAGKSVDFVDMFSSGVPGALDVKTDISARNIDTGVHPTAQGYDKIGNFWFNSLNSTIGTAQGTYKVDQDSLVNIKNIIGSTFNDTIISGSGSNVLTGNGGTDTFFYRTPNDGNDTITDFGTDDRFQISAAGFGGGLTAGVALSGAAASTGVFVNGSSAISGNATFLYSGGSLWFDADGTGAGSQVKIADLSTQPSLSASQFTIVA